MLVFSRKVNQSIVIDGRIIITIIRVREGSVKIGIQAPAEIPVHRKEVYDEIQQANREALGEQRPVPKLKRPKPESPGSEPSGSQDTPDQ